LWRKRRLGLKKSRIYFGIERVNRDRVRMTKLIKWLISGSIVRLLVFTIDSWQAVTDPNDAVASAHAIGNEQYMHEAQNATPGAQSQPLAT
jgi:hypothetical protein